MTEKLTPQQILSLPIGDGNLSDAKTVGQYIARLGKAAYINRDAEYPFGNSDWETPLLFSFANANLMWLRTDENGLIDDYSDAAFTEIFASLYEFLFRADFSTLTLPPEPKEWYLVSVDTRAKVNPELEDFDYDAYTEKDAKTKAEELNSESTTVRWVAIHIPPVS